MPNLSTFLSLCEICLKEINDESRLPQDPGEVLNGAQRPREKSRETDQGRASDHKDHRGKGSPQATGRRGPPTQLPSLHQPPAGLSVLLCLLPGACRLSQTRGWDPHWVSLSTGSGWQENPRVEPSRLRSWPCSHSGCGESWCRFSSTLDFAEAALTRALWGRASSQATEGVVAGRHQKHVTAGCSPSYIRAIWGSSPPVSPVKAASKGLAFLERVKCCWDHLEDARGCSRLRPLCKLLRFWQVVRRSTHPSLLLPLTSLAWSAPCLGLSLPASCGGRVVNPDRVSSCCPSPAGNEVRQMG